MMKINALQSRSVSENAGNESGAHDCEIWNETVSDAEEAAIWNWNTLHLSMILIL